MLVDGVWTTRRIEIQTAIDENIRASSSAQAEAPVSSTKRKAVPSMGILTRTLIESPIVRWIIPARIRHKDKNDVVFIGVSSQLLKEARRRPSASIITRLTRQYCRTSLS